ncbi:ATP-binding cassette domain-containing protein [Acidisphaera sp. S103]|uniref:ATP-binding cassette domain-containing protein n=1 Tax=Acidisphaera sp. S103 TaxID=1747223 RepID=UPI00131C2FF4|nr:ATP-binding cassette domain-containing protein [Acidisphaera sp. S103]
MFEARIDRKVFVAPDGTRRQVLRDVRVSIAGGEVIALLGSSGIGKSTTLRILLGLDTAFDGAVQHRDWRIGVVFQEPRLLPWLTVADNLRLVVTDGMPQPDIGALLEMVRLPNAADLYPRQLSLGMARRAALARALAVSPELLALDEPFASLDPQLAAALADVVGRWTRDTGAAVLLATHDLAQALQLASRVLVLAGTPATLAADVPVPAGNDAATRAALQADLASRFPFFTANGDGLPGASLTD